MTTSWENFRQRRIGVFAYNFPHKKTEDLLLKLFLRGVPVNTVLAANPVKLALPPSLRTKIRHTAVDHPGDIAHRIGASYHVVPHNSAAAREIIRNRKLDVGIIAGARILTSETIDAFPMGVINFHPGDIPAVRGLNALLRSIVLDVPLCVTAHLIDSRVDAGALLVKQVIAIHKDDTVWDLSHRLYETQLDLLLPALEAATSGNATPVNVCDSHHNSLTLDAQQKAIDDVANYVKRHLRPEPERVWPSPPARSHAS